MHRLDSIHKTYRRAMRRALASVCAVTSVCAVGIPVLTALGEEPTPQPSETQTTQRQAPQSDVIVAAFQHSWNTVAAECTNTYGPEGVGYVQIAPPAESITGSEWWTSYQPVSYKLDSRYGTQAELKSMVETCSAAGVAVIADVELNHTTGTDSSWIDDMAGVAGSAYNGTYGRYPEFGTADDAAVGKGLYRFQDNGNNHQYGLTTKDFHDCPSKVEDFTDANHVWNCRQLTMWDLNTSSERVREIQANYLASLWNLGVRGFRISSGKYMDPKDIAAVKTKLAKKIGIEAQDIFYSQEVVYHNNEADKFQPERYTGNGNVVEFRYAYELLQAFSGSTLGALRNIKNAGVDSAHATAIVANWNTVRGSETLNPQSGAKYELANAFMLANDYGRPLILSDYFFDDAHKDAGPQGTTDTRVPDIDMQTQCTANTKAANQWAWGSWHCQPHWTSTRGLIGFHNAVTGTTATAWQEPRTNHIGFARRADDGTDRGFFAINNTLVDAEVTYTTTLPDGIYCNVYATRTRNCAEEYRVSVQNGTFTTTVPARSALALHVGAEYDAHAAGADDYTPGYQDEADLGRIADHTLTQYYHSADGTTPANAVFTSDDGTTHTVPMNAVEGHDGWYVARIADINTGAAHVSVDSGTSYTVPIGATFAWIDGDGLHQGTPFASTDTGVHTTFTVHAAETIAATGVVVTAADGTRTYHAFTGDDSYGKRLEMTIPGVVDNVAFRIVNGEGVDAPTSARTQDMYTATLVEHISGAIEAWVDGDGAMSLKAPASTAANGAPIPGDQKTPQELNVTVHYRRGDGNYQEYDLERDAWLGWDMWTWVREGTSGGMVQFTKHDDWGEIATFRYIENEKGVREPSFIVRQGGDAWLGKDPDDNDRHIPEPAIHVDGNDPEHGTVEIWLVAGDPTMYTYQPAVTGVTFDTRGGSAVPAQTLAVGRAAHEPEAPTRAGYMFRAWTTDPAGEHPYDFATPVHDPVTLYAQWTESYTVSFDLMGGLADDGTEEIAPVTVARGTSTTITQRATRDGYTFLGWASVAGGTVTVPVNAQLTLERDTVLYAVWEALPHTVTFDVNGGVAADGSGDGKVIVKHDERVEEPAASARPTRDGMQFVGWTIERDGNAPYDFAAPVTNDLTLYAKWADEHAVIHTLTLDHRDGDGTVSRMFVEEGTVTLPGVATMKRDGYRFDGWMRNADGDGDADITAGGQVEVTGDLTLYAKWVKVWNVTFDAGADADGSGDGSGGGSGGSGGVHVKQVDDGAPAEQPTGVERDGYRLEGWKLADTDDDTLYDLTQPVHGDMRLVAVWRHAGTPWTVRFNLNGGSVDPRYAAQVADQRVYDGEFAKRPEFKDSLGEELDQYKPQRKGYRFQGWSTVKNDALGLSVFRFDKQPIDRNCTLYALWERV